MAPLFGGSAAHHRRLDPTQHVPGTKTALAVPDSGPATELARHLPDLIAAHRAEWGDATSFEHPRRACSGHAPLTDYRRRRSTQAGGAGAAGG
jgi:hypothetical protein